jgi:hypothetical protein
MRHQQSISFSFLEDLRVPRSRKICAGGGALSSNCAVAPFVSLKSNVFCGWHVPCGVRFATSGRHACAVRSHGKNKTIQPIEESSMKAKQLLTICGVAAALLLSAGSIFAQNDNGGDQQGNGGGRRFRGGPGGNFDPAQFQQRMMERIQQDLGFTNDTEWSAVQPLVQKVFDAQRDARGPGMRAMFGRNRGGNNGGGRFGPPPSPEYDALQKAIDDNAPAAQIKDLLAKYQASQKEKQAKLVAAQADLRKVLTVKQEAQATLIGLLD